MWIPDIFFHLSPSWHCHLHLSWDFSSPSLNWETVSFPLTLLVLVWSASGQEPR